MSTMRLTCGTGYAERSNRFPCDVGGIICVGLQGGGGEGGQRIDDGVRQVGNSWI